MGPQKRPREALSCVAGTFLLCFFCTDGEADEGAMTGDSGAAVAVDDVAAAARSAISAACVIYPSPLLLLACSTYVRVDCL